MGDVKHILVVDDDPSIRDVVKTFLVSEGFRVSLAADGKAMRELMDRDPVDLAILDLMLPGEDGFALARFLREQHHCGIIMLTGKTDSTDLIVGLEVGADDYVSKPYKSRELLARIRSVLRRVGEKRPAAQAPEGAKDIACFGKWRFDIGTRSLAAENGKTVALTTGEFNLLTEFVTKPNRVLSREHLLNAVHSRNYDYFDRSIDVLVTRLRRKLETDKTNPEIIKTVRGAGYIFTAKVSHRAA